MNKSTGWIVLVCVALFAHSAEGQLPDDPGFGGGGGLIGWLSLANLDSLNDLLSLNGFAALDSALPVFGGWASAGSLNGWRIGGRGASGEVFARSGEKTASLALNYGGLHFDYGLLANERYNLSVGATIGGGDAVLTLNTGSPTTFSEAVVDPRTAIMTREFFLVQPTLSVGFQTWVFYLSLSGTYLVTLPGDWLNGGARLPGPPDNFNGWSAELSVTFGWGDQDDTPMPNNNGLGSGK